MREATPTCPGVLIRNPGGCDQMFDYGLSQESDPCSVHISGRKGGSVADYRHVLDLGRNIGLC